MIGKKVTKEPLPTQLIRLLTLSTEREGPVYLTFTGSFLVGAVFEQNGLWIGVGKVAASKDWDNTSDWVICQAESGKLVVYYIAEGARTVGGKVSVYADWQELEGNAPPKLIHEAKLKAGMFTPPNIPEVRLTEAE